MNCNNVQKDKFKNVIHIFNNVESNKKSAFEKKTLKDNTGYSDFEFQPVQGEQFQLLFKDEILSSDRFDCSQSLDHAKESTNTANLKSALSTAHVIIGEPDLEDIKSNKNLEWIQMTWAGTDKYTCHKGFPEHVTLTNMSGAFGTIMSEYAIGAILSCYRNFPVYHEQQNQQIWKDAGSEDSLFGKTVLFLGTGDIGSNTAKRLQAFGTINIGVRRNPEKTSPYFDKIFSFDQLDKILPMADIIICSLPNKPETRNLLNKKRLLLMKKTAVLLNMGRGSLIVTDDLVDVLSQGHFRGVILDVTNPEPLPADHPLWSCKKVMITPHVAGPSLGHCPDTEDRIVDICCENIRHYLHKEPLKNVIPKEEFE